MSETAFPRGGYAVDPITQKPRTGGPTSDVLFGNKTQKRKLARKKAGGKKKPKITKNRRKKRALLATDICAILSPKVKTHRRGTLAFFVPCWLVGTCVRVFTVRSIRCPQIIFSRVYKWALSCLAWLHVWSQTSSWSAFPTV